MKYSLTDVTLENLSHDAKTKNFTTYLQRTCNKMSTSSAIAKKKFQQFRNLLYRYTSY